MMKRMVIVVMVAVMVAVFGGVCRADLEGLNAVDYVDGLRAEALKVISVDAEHDVIVCESWAGVEWTFEGAEDYTPGDIVAVIFATCYTSNIYDDMVLSVSYSGYIG